VIAVVCADLTREKGGFNALQGLLATGTWRSAGFSVRFLAGPLVQHLGFAPAFPLSFRAGSPLSVQSCFLAFMQETRLTTMKEKRLMNTAVMEPAHAFHPGRTV